MNLTKFEQSGFILETNDGYRFGWDIATRTPIEKISGIKPLDSFLVSHIHGDHFSPEHINTLSPSKVFLNSQCVEAEGSGDIKSEIAIVKVGDEINIDKLKIKLFEADHGPNVEQPRDNIGFLLEADGQEIYFAGDMFNPSGIPVEDLEVDIALLPVGTHYTFGPEEAFNFAKQFKSIGKIIPIHYSPNNYIYPETRDEFIELASKDFNVDEVNLS